MMVDFRSVAHFQISICIVPGGSLSVYPHLLLFHMFFFFMISKINTSLSYVENERSIFDTILRGHIDFLSDPWPSLSSSAKDLVKKMLQEDPKKRPSAFEVLGKFH